MIKICVEPLSPHEGGVFKIHDDPESANKGGGMFTICGEPESPHEGPCLRYNFGEPESPNEVACARYVKSHYRQMKGRVQDI